MANTIRIKRSTGSSAPATAANAELAFSEGNKTLWYGNGDNGSGVATSVIAIGGTGAFLALDGSLAQTITGNKTFSGATVLGTPQSGTLTNCTALPLTTGVTGVLGVSNGGTGNTTLAGAGIAALASPTFTGTVNCAALTSSGHVVVGGNLTVNGTTTTVNSTVTTVDDPIITLGGDTAPVSDDSRDRGVEFRWHNGTTAKIGFFGFDDSTGYLTFIPDATNTTEVFSGVAGDIEATNFRGALIGNASTATNVAYSGLTGTVPTWNQNTTGNAATATTATTAATATNVAYSGLTGTVPTWNQNTTGNATTATTATTATNATNVAVTSDNTNTSYFVPFLSAATGNNGLKADAGTGANGLTYNPSTATLTVGTVSGLVSTTAVNSGTTLSLATSGGAVTAAPADGNVILAPTNSNVTGGTIPSLTVGFADAAAGLVTVAGGDLYLSTKTNAASAVSSVNIIFEGGTSNGFKTTVAAADPTASRTITLPNATGTVALTTDLSQFAATTSAQLAGVISDETGTGLLVFATNPVLTTPNIGIPSAGILTNCTGTASGLTAGLVTNGLYTTSTIDGGSY